MAKDSLRSDTSANGLDGHGQLRDGSVHGTAAKGYAEHHCDGSEYDKYGNRIDYGKLAATTFK